MLDIRFGRPRYAIHLCLPRYTPISEWHTDRNQFSSFSWWTSPCRSAGGDLQSAVGSISFGISLQCRYCCSRGFVPDCCLSPPFAISSLQYRSIALLCAITLHSTIFKCVRFQALAVYPLDLATWFKIVTLLTSIRVLPISNLVWLQPSGTAFVFFSYPHRGSEEKCFWVGGGHLEYILCNSLLVYNIRGCISRPLSEHGHVLYDPGFNPCRARNFYLLHIVRTGCGVHPVLCQVGTGRDIDYSLSSYLLTYLLTYLLHGAESLLRS
jgi:hypothetical protein